MSLKPDLSRVDRAGADVDSVVLVLPGGKPESHSPSRSWHLSNLRMVGVAETVRGAAPASAVYRLRYRQRGWNPPDFPAVEDGRKSLAQLAHVHPGLPIMLIGHSMGGRVAAAVASHPAVIGVLALAPWWPEGEADAIPAETALIVVHGDEDRWTSAPASRQAVQRALARGGRAEHHSVAGAGHFMLTHRDCWNSLISAATRSLVPTADASRAPAPGRITPC